MTGSLQSVYPQARPGSRPLQVAAIVGLGLIGAASWRFEVEHVVGWNSLQWIYRWPRASCVVSLSVAIALLVTTSRLRVVPISRRAWYLLFVTALGLLAFAIARNGHLETARYALHTGSGLLFRFSAEVGGAWVLAAFGVSLLGRHCLGLPSRPSGPAYSLAIALVPLFSVATIHLLPAPNGATDYVHAVKVGYPAFWTPVLMGLVEK